MKKVLSNVMFELHNVRMELSNVKKKKGTTKCDKITVTYDVGTAQCKYEIVKYEEKVREPPNVTKVQSHVKLVLHNMRMIPSNVRKIREPLNVTKE